MYRTALNERMSLLIQNVKRTAINTVSTKLSKKGLVSTGARGIAAPDITVLDAVNTLLGVVATGSPIKAVEAVMQYRPLVGESGACCGLNPGKEPWTLGEILEALLSNPGICQFLEKLIVCRTEPYAEIHWKKEGVAENMIFGNKPDTILKLEINCTLSGAMLHQFSSDLSKDQ